MREWFGRDQVSVLRARGFTRRDFGRVAALLGAGAALPFYNEAALAQDLRAIGTIPPDAVKINANENPMGPCPAAIEAVREVIPQGGRYLFQCTFDFLDTMAEVEALPADHVMAFAGSSDPLHRAVLAFTGPGRPLVTADPGYEAPERAARFVGAKVVRVPLRPDFAHDARAMAGADPKAGLIYVCNPNNPTGTVTRRADLDALVAGKPEGTVILLDEAYVHFAHSIEPATDLVRDGKDVVILRTFSKIYGMAGLRAGAALGRPDLLEKLKAFGGLGIVPATGMAGATASLRQKGLVSERRRAVAEVREGLCSWLDKKGYSYIPSEANMVMVDGKRPGRQTVEAMLKEKVAIGRSWPSHPTHVRVTIGTADEMARFRTAFERVMDA